MIIKSLEWYQQENPRARDLICAITARFQKSTNGNPNLDTIKGWDEDATDQPEFIGGAELANIKQIKSRIWNVTLWKLYPVWKPLKTMFNKNTMSFGQFESSPSGWNIHLKLWRFCDVLLRISTFLSLGNISIREFYLPISIKKFIKNAVKLAHKSYDCSLVPYINFSVALINND
jgi:hypothetical protein